MTKAELKFILKKHNINPDASRGQNFLLDSHILKKIAASGQLTKNDTVLEIGPGIGNLTQELAHQAGSVVSVEIDRRFESILGSISSVEGNINIVYGDILKISEEDSALASVFDASQYKIIANIPYYLTSKLIKKVLAFKELPERIIFLIQKEVAERICEQPGRLSKLALSVQMYATPKIIHQVPKESFYPAPEVDSAVLEISDIHRWNVTQDEALVWRVIAFGFSSKRKKLVNNLAAGLHKEKNDVAKMLEAAGVDGNQRAQDISISQWCAIADEV